MKESRKVKTIALFPAHPSQVWILREVEKSLSGKYRFLWFIRDKDISLELAEKLGIEYEIISKARTGIIGNGIELLQNIFKCRKLIKRHNIDLWITKYSSAHIASKMLGLPTIGFIDDDIDQIRFIAYSSFPFCDKIIAPKVTDTGRFDKKTVRFDGNFELCYLHPKRFEPDDKIYEELGITKSQKYAIIRLASLKAHHDVGKKGLSDDTVKQVIQMCEPDIKIFITSEKPLSPEFEPYRLMVPVHRIHHVLYYAEFFLGDSQTMTSEAAILGTPAFRINSFVGELAIIELLEEEKIAFGYKPDQSKQLLEDIKHHILKDDKSVFLARRNRILERWEDPIDVFGIVIENLGVGSY